jgi:excisionase family DNA binding protein
VGIVRLDAEVVETVAGVVRLLRRAAELLQAVEAGSRSSRQLLALGIDAAANEASSLLPRWARLEGAHASSAESSTEFLASAEHLFRQIGVEGAPFRLRSLRAMVGELIWDANTSAGASARANRTTTMSWDHTRGLGTHQPQGLDPKWYTVSQVAQLLGYGETKIRMLIISGDLRSLKDGRSRRVLPEWVEDYVRLRASQAKDT